LAACGQQEASCLLNWEEARNELAGLASQYWGFWTLLGVALWGLLVTLARAMFIIFRPGQLFPVDR